MQQGQPILFASRMLTKTEQKYAQIEKETLAILFACKRFDQYIFGSQRVVVETDHLPLLAIFKKPISSAPKRIQRMVLSLQRYNLEVKYVKGSKLILADTLSRNVNVDQTADIEEMDALWKAVEEVNTLQHLEIQDDLLKHIKQETNKDEICATLKDYILNGWPKDKSLVVDCAKPYYPFHSELVMQDGIILRGERIVVPAKSRMKALELLHYSHQGEQATLRKARTVVYWPNMTDHIRNYVKKCEACNKFKPCQASEPMQSVRIPSFPYDIVSMDLAEISVATKKHILLITVDHFSNFFDIDVINNQTTKSLIDCSKRNFSRFGIPRQVITDSAKQFTCEEWKKLMVEYGIQHTTSAPYHHEANGKAESAVKIGKNVIKKALQEGKDIWLALLEWRNTPQSDGYTPTQKLMGRKTRGIFPVPQHQLQIKPVDADRVRDDIETRKVRSKFHHDRAAQELPKLQRGQEVYVQLKPESTTEWTRGRVAEVLTDRDYQVQVGETVYRRNRKYLRDANASAFCGYHSASESNSNTETSADSFLSAASRREQQVVDTPGRNMSSSIKFEPTGVFHSTPTQLSSAEPIRSPGTEQHCSSSVRADATSRPKRAIRRPLWLEDYEVED